MTSELIKIKDRMLKKYPKIDDHNLPEPSDIHENLEQRYTFANFDRIIAGKHKKGVSLEPKLYDDNTDVSFLIRIIQSKLTEVDELVEKKK